MVFCVMIRKRRLEEAVIPGNLGPLIDIGPLALETRVMLMLTKMEGYQIHDPDEREVPKYA